MVIAGFSRVLYQFSTDLRQAESDLSLAEIESNEILIEHGRGRFAPHHPEGCPASSQKECDDQRRDEHDHHENDDSEDELCKILDIMAGLARNGRHVGFVVNAFDQLVGFVLDRVSADDSDKRTAAADFKG